MRGPLRTSESMYSTMQKNEHPFPVGAVLLIVAAFLGATVNVGYWVYAKRGADSFETPLFQAASTVHTLEEACKKEREASEKSMGQMFADVNTDEVIVERPETKSCDAVGPATVRRNELQQNQEVARANAWQAVPPLILWPVLAGVGLFFYARGQRR